MQTDTEVGNRRRTCPESTQILTALTILCAKEWRQFHAAPPQWRIAARGAEVLQPLGEPLFFVRPTMRRILLCLPLLYAVAAHAEAPKDVLVVNSLDADLSVIDVATQTVQRRVPLLREPHHWVMTPDGKDLLIGDTVANTLFDLDPDTFAVRRQITMPDPYQMLFTPDGTKLVVAGLARKQVDVYQTGTYKLLHRFAADSMPSHIDISHDSSTAYVSLQGTNKAMALDLRNYTVKWEAPTDGAPAGVLLHNGKLLVATMDTDTVQILDANTGATLGRIKATKGAHQVFISPDKTMLFINSRIDSTITVVDANTFQHLRTYRVPGGPDDLIFMPGNKIWTTLRFAKKVGVLDLASGALETIPVGRSPHGIYVKGAVNQGGNN
jgi:YVTN family beta-propeller protein